MQPKRRRRKTYKLEETWWKKWEEKTDAKKETIPYSLIFGTLKKKLTHKKRTEEEEYNEEKVERKLQITIIYY